MNWNSDYVGFRWKNFFKVVWHFLTNSHKWGKCGFHNLGGEGKMFHCDGCDLDEYR